MKSWLLIGVWIAQATALATAQVPDDGIRQLRYPGLPAGGGYRDTTERLRAGSPWFVAPVGALRSEVEYLFKLAQPQLEDYAVAKAKNNRRQDTLLGLVDNLPGELATYKSNLTTAYLLFSLRGITPGNASYGLNGQDEEQKPKGVRWARSKRMPFHVADRNYREIIKLSKYDPDRLRSLLRSQNYRVHYAAAMHAKVGFLWTLFQAMYAQRDYSKTRLLLVLDAAYQAAWRVPDRSPARMIREARGVYLRQFQAIARQLGRRLAFAPLEEDLEPRGERIIPYIFYHGSGRMSERGILINYKMRHRSLVRFDPKGQVTYRATFNRGVESGIREVYTGEGRRRTLLTVRVMNGRREGEAVLKLVGSGRVRTRWHYENDQLNGITRHYGPDGKLTSRETYRNGIRDGVTVRYVLNPIYKKRVTIREVWRAGRLISRTSSPRLRGAVPAR